ncbi:hypothetical protein EYF80_036843 [Liparis tanakae]|uniref:Uncharacterized protein n=1 Tax=Liparis tanakae TaxID=230148 RepID=A0A4Z2GHF1_9TELE|nr:hypothetical protein EYF80_036843 [Liparis tanakae]
MAMLSNTPMKGMTAIPPPRPCTQPRGGGGGPAVRAATSLCILTCTISPKVTTVPLAVVSVVGGGLNGGSPRDVSPVTVNTGFLASLEQVGASSEPRVFFMNSNATSRARQRRPSTTSPILASGIL